MVAVLQLFVKISLNARLSPEGRDEPRDPSWPRPKPQSQVSAGSIPAPSEEGPAGQAVEMVLRAVSGILCRWEQFDKKYLSQLLMRRSAYRIRDQIWDVYYRLNIRDAISFVDQVGLW